MRYATMKKFGVLKEEASDSMWDDEYMGYRISGACRTYIAERGDTCFTSIIEVFNPEGKWVHATKGSLKGVKAWIRRHIKKQSGLVMISKIGEPQTSWGPVPRGKVPEFIANHLDLSCAYIVKPVK